MSDKLSFLSELKRRNVYKVAAAYIVVSWLLIQAASILFPTFDAPPWAMKGNDIGWIRVDPLLDPLRGDPRFEALAEKIVPAREFRGSSK